MWVLLDKNNTHPESTNHFLVSDIFEEKPPIEESDNFYLVEVDGFSNDRTIIYWSYYSPTVKTIIKDPVLEVTPGRTIGELPVTVL